jgi:hypothetical protein
VVGSFQASSSHEQILTTVNDGIVGYLRYWQRLQSATNSGHKLCKTKFFNTNSLMPTDVCALTMNMNGDLDFLASSI